MYLSLTPEVPVGDTEPVGFVAEVLQHFQRLGIAVQKERIGPDRITSSIRSASPITVNLSAKPSSVKA